MILQIVINPVVLTLGMTSVERTVSITTLVVVPTISSMPESMYLSYCI